jgi:hypothetical protein
MKFLVLAFFFSTSVLLSTLANAKNCDVRVRNETEKRALDSYKVLVHYVLRPFVLYNDNTSTGFNLSAGNNQADAVLFTNALGQKKFLENEFPVVANYKNTFL